MPALNQSSDNLDNLAKNGMKEKKGNAPQPQKKKSTDGKGSNFKASKSATTSSLFETSTNTSTKKLTGTSSIPKALNALSDSGDEEDLESSPVITGNEVGDNANNVTDSAPTAPMNSKGKKKSNRNAQRKGQ